MATGASSADEPTSCRCSSHPLIGLLISMEKLLTSRFCTTKRVGLPRRRRSATGMTIGRARASHRMPADRAGYGSNRMTRVTAALGVGTRWRRLGVAVVRQWPGRAKGRWAASQAAADAWLCQPGQCIASVGCAAAAARSRTATSYTSASTLVKRRCAAAADSAVQWMFPRLAAASISARRKRKFS
jgi:hypothetical protein